MGNFGPGNIGGPAKPKVSSKSKEAAQKPKPASKDIWDESEVPTSAVSEDIQDSRPQPEYDITYRQSVGTEDVFLQMGNRTGATMSCENMVVRVKLPNTKIADVHLDVKKTFLDCRSPNFKLGLHLPHPVDEASAGAEFNSDTNELSVTLRVIREFDEFHY